MSSGKPIDQERQVSASYTYDDNRATGAPMLSAPDLQANINDLRTIIRLTTGEAGFEDAPITSVKGLDGRVTVNEGDIATLQADKLDASAHQSLRQLIHFIDHGPTAGFASGAYLETTPPAAPFPTVATWWTSAAKTAKIVEQTVVYGLTQAQITQSVWVMYAADGTTPVETVTDTASYSGTSPYPTSTTRVIS